jgi:histidine triad (HIT) family protein
MDDCLFCRIVTKKIPAAIVHETDKTLAFRDIHPEAPVHVLVIPKEHVPSLFHWEAKHSPLLSAVHESIQAVVRETGVAKSGFRVVVNTGPDAQQTVQHVHYHVLGGRSLSWPPG